MPEGRGIMCSMSYNGIAKSCSERVDQIIPVIGKIWSSAQTESDVEIEYHKPNLLS